ncbi:SusC/RagA family TonB-linked outer membrane protein [Zhouia sp. PK063]|uniref:SusC/RagA family TonB-linked outer membrane protein n=1 Tax=Zhouia sp. PK063 TaxID=3373602 RepID=UPI0037ADC6B0
MKNYYTSYHIKALSFLSALLLCIFSASAQVKSDTITLSNQIQGKVVDLFGNPIENVQVENINQELLATTNEKGVFKVANTNEAILVYQHPNYYTKQLKVDFGFLEIRMQPRYLKHDDNLDVLFDNVQKQSYVGSAATIYTNQLTTTLAQTYVHALPGRLAGLYTEQYRGIRSSQTGSNTDLNIFTGAGIPKPGQNRVSADNTQFSLNVRGQSPVVVIDGVQRDLSSIDPQNIESISVQKDALSSILLGMRSSRGAVLVTTKNANQKGFRLSFTEQTGFQSSLNMPDPLPAYEYAYLLNEGLQRTGKSPVYTQADFEAFRNGTDPYGHPNVNWYDKLIKDDAPISAYNLNVSGGSEKAKYFVSLGYFTQEGFFKTLKDQGYDTNEKLDRYMVTTKLNVDVTDDFNVELSLFGRVEEGNQPGATTNQILSDIYRTPNSAYPIFNPDGSYGGNKPFSRNLYAETVNSGYLKDIKKDVLATINVDYDLHKFVKGLHLKGTSSVSVQNRTAINRSKQNQVYEFKAGNDGEAGTYSVYGTLSNQANSFIAAANSRYWYGQAALEYKTTFNEHTFEAKVLGDQYIVGNNYDLPQNSADIAGTVKYNYNNRYFAEAAVNHSYFNGYKPGQQWGTFYAFGVGWDIAQENFLSKANWLNQFKIRATYGKTGNGIDNAGYYGWRKSYSTVGFLYELGYSTSVGNGVNENAPLYNPNISWENAHKLNLGADVSLFNNTLQLTGDFYYDNYYDLLQTRGKSIELLGFGYPSENIGKNRYSGTELSITYQNNIGDFNYYITANWNQQHSERVFLDEQYKPETYNKLTGKPVNTIFGYVADGFWQSREEIDNSATVNNPNIQPGDIKYKDLNGDGIINDFDVAPIGNTKPLTFYGVNFGFNYKGFDLSVLLQGVYNRDIYFNNDQLQAGFTDFNQSYAQAYILIRNRWTPENAATATIPGLRPGNSIFNSSPSFQYTSSYFVYSGDYFRLKNVSIGYTFPDSVTKQLAGIQLRVFANGTNLFTQSKFDLGDPEVTSFTSYPLQRVISAGVNVKF